MILNVNSLKDLMSADDMLIPASGYPETLIGVSPINKLKDRTLSFLSKHSKEFLPVIIDSHGSIVVVNKGYKEDIRESESLLVFSERPRYTYAWLLTEFLKRAEPTGISKPCIGADTLISPTAVIHDGAAIGTTCVIMDGAIINRGVTIGNNCIVRENAVLGGYGFGIEKDADGINYRIPHLGGVVLGDDVEVGAFSSIASGTMEPTVIEDDVKIDDHVHIGHNIRVGANTIITAGVVVGGSTEIGRGCWIGLNSTIRDGIIVADGVIVGMGAIVSKSVMSRDMLIAEATETMTQKMQTMRRNRDIGKKMGY